MLTRSTLDFACVGEEITSDISLLIRPYILSLNHQVSTRLNLEFNESLVTFYSLSKRQT